MRPNILMFGDWDWDSSISDEQSRKYDKFLKKAHKKTVVIELGCGTAVPTIRNMCERAYYNNKDSVLIRINPDEDSAHKWMDKERYVHVKMGALEALEEIKRFS